MAVLSIALVSTSLGIVLISDSAHSGVAHASPSLDSKDDKDKDKERKRRSDDRDEDHVFNGQVLEIDTLKDPPELIVGSVDGPTVVRVLKTDEIALNGARLGDHVELTGEKIHEQLFEATEISVSERYSSTPVSDDKKP